tara:strand:+ start:487 stop:825 length:339 start_codon:yes stop_codon:yes gene_type:complete
MNSARIAMHQKFGKALKGCEDKNGKQRVSVEFDPRSDSWDVEVYCNKAMRSILKNLTGEIGTTLEGTDCVWVDLTKSALLRSLDSMTLGKGQVVARLNIDSVLTSIHFRTEY